MSGRTRFPRQPAANHEAPTTDLPLIEDERQYRITREQAEKFERALRQLAHRPVDVTADPRFRDIEEAALQGQLNDLRAQLAEYEARAAARGKSGGGRIGPRKS
jgi:hypothetical protein